MNEGKIERMKESNKMSEKLQKEITVKESLNEKNE